MAHNQSFQYIKDPFLFGKPNVLCRLSDVVMLFAPAVLVFNVSKFLRFAVSEFQSFTASLFQSFIAAPLFPKSKPRLRLFAFKSGSPEQTKILSVCYGEKRRYELLSMIEQSDIIRAISLPNAERPLNCRALPIL